jgi:uracil-DNA glycosylase family 4
MKKKVINELSFISKEIEECYACSNIRFGMNSHLGGKAIPFWSERSWLMAIAEAPGKEEVENKTPLVGPAGKIFFSKMEKIGLIRKDFILINSIQCRPIDIFERNDKPLIKEQINCKKLWIDKYIEIFEPEYILAVGKYAINSLMGNNNKDFYSITKLCGKILSYEHSSNKPPIKVFPFLHPARLIYIPEDSDLFDKSLRCLLKHIKKDKRYKPSK